MAVVVKYAVLVVVLIVGNLSYSAEANISFPKARALATKVQATARQSIVHKFAKHLGQWFNDLDYVIDRIQNEKAKKDLKKVIEPLMKKCSAINKELKAINGTVSSIRVNAIRMQGLLRKAMNDRRKGKPYKKNFARANSYIKRVYNNAVQTLKRFNEIYQELVQINGKELRQIVMKYKKEIWGDRYPE